MTNHAHRNRATPLITATTETEKERELPVELKGFVDRVIVPLLVEQWMAENGHLYSDTLSRYDTEEPLSRAA